MLVLGVVGGVASGKSYVAEQFRGLGAAVLNADHAGHEVLRECEVLAAIRQRWGEGVLLPDGQVNRSAVAKIVFAPICTEEKRFLEQITHPRIAARLEREFDELCTAGTCPAVILDAALLFEAGWDRLCHDVIFVAAPLTTRLARAAQRGWSAEQLAQRESQQLPLAEKQRRCRWTVQNGERDDVTAQVQRIWHELRLASCGGAGQEPSPSPWVSHQ